jgi:hypothetical protein
MRTTKTNLVDDASTAFAPSTAGLSARDPDLLSTTSHRGRDTRSPTEAVE